MPNYDYRCQKCGEVFEVHATLQQKIAGLQPECPQCHSQQTEQQYRALNVIRTGNGQSAMPVSSCCPARGPGGC